MSGRSMDRNKLFLVGGAAAATLALGGLVYLSRKKKVDPVALKNEGNEAFKIQDYPKALDFYTRAINADPQNSVILCNRSVTYCLLDRFDDALRDAEKSIELDPSNARAYERLGQALAGLDRHEQALVAYEKSLELNPGAKSVLNKKRESSMSLSRRHASSAQVNPTKPAQTTATASNTPAQPIPVKKQPAKGSAFVFLMPTIATPGAISLIKTALLSNSLVVKTEGDLSAEEIDSSSKVDLHFFRLANAAMLSQPSQFDELDTAHFEQLFQIPWAAALEQGLVLNAADASTKLGLDADTLAALRLESLTKGLVVNLAPAIECAKIESQGSSYYVLNASYLSLRERFTKAGTHIHYIVVEWESGDFDWGNLRQLLQEQLERLFGEWEDLGIAQQPRPDEILLHASSSPLASLAERRVWLGANLNEDSFGRRLLDASIPLAAIEEWCSNPVIKLQDGQVLLFDALDGLNADQSFQILSQMSRANA